MTVQRASDHYASNLKTVLEINVVCPIVNALVGRLLGAYDLGVATPRALVHAGDKTSGDARSWYMISGDAKSWVVIVLHIFTVILHNCLLFIEQLFGTTTGV
ncbi:hypothetical protein Tco_1435981 [Tanacetum coccineum]